MFKKLRTVIYHVDDIEKAKEWYKKITGITPYFSESFYVGFNVYGCELGLDPDMEKVNKGEQSVAYWSVDDINACVQTLIESGASLISAIQNVGDNIKVAVVKDPFGNHIGLIEEQVGGT